jgi:drug/metabolite transporter (DMT)-like permease
MKTNVSAYLCLAAAMALAGSSVVAGKVLTQQLPVFLAAAASLLTALLVLLPLAWKIGGGLWNVPKNDLKLLALQALTGMVGFRIFLLYGLKTTSAAAGGIITSTMPAVVGLISFLVLREKPTWHKAGGITAAVAAVLVLNQAGRSGVGDWSLWGNVLVFLAVLGEALFVILQKWISKETLALTRTALVSLFGFIFFLPFAVYEGLKFDFAALGWVDCLVVVYYGVVVTALAYILFYKGAAAVPATTVGVFGGFMPIASVLLSSLILGEVLLLQHLLSLGLVVAGIVLIAAGPETDHLLPATFGQKRRRRENN